MKTCKNIILILFVCMSIQLMRCSVKDWFKQPRLTYNSYRLLQLPTETTNLMVNADVKNEDLQNGDITSITYTATVEGVPSLEMTYGQNIKIKSGETQTRDMPLTFTTDGSLALLSKINKGTPLNYTVTGSFEAETFFGSYKLPLDIAGSAVVIVDIDDFFKQPSVEVQSFKLNSTTPACTFSGCSSGTMNITAKLTNNAQYGATVKSVKYTVTIEGLTSDQMTYSSQMVFDPNGGAVYTLTRNDLPVSFTVSIGNITSIVSLWSKVNSQVNFHINGTMTVNSTIGGISQDFVLPLSTTGDVLLLP
jgi:hypothetical protein